MITLITYTLYILEDVLDKHSEEPAQRAAGRAQSARAALEESIAYLRARAKARPSLCCGAPLRVVETATTVALVCTQCGEKSLHLNKKQI